MNIQQLMKHAQSMQAKTKKSERELSAKETTVETQGLKIPGVM